MTTGNLQYSPLESKRFEKIIFRGNLNTLDAALIKDVIEKENPDILIFRIPVTEQARLHELEQLQLPMIVADTLVYYNLSLESMPEKSLKNTLRFVPAGASDAAILQEQIPVIFKDYTNHYFSNPLLDRKKIIEGYTEWAINHISGDDKISFLVYEKEEMLAFATCSFSGKESEGVLYGVMPQHSGKGIYADLIRYTQNYFKEKGFSSMKVSTQIQNYAVQKVWIREGFNISHAYLTIHINNKKPAL